jgi:hypothetical protein
MGPNASRILVIFAIFLSFAAIGSTLPLMPLCLRQDLGLDRFWTGVLVGMLSAAAWMVDSAPDGQRSQVLGDLASRVWGGLAVGPLVAECPPGLTPRGCPWRGALAGLMQSRCVRRVFWGWAAGNGASGDRPWEAGLREWT